MNNSTLRELHLIRHAKSSWANLDLADIDRPLNKRGKSACVRMAQYIFDENALTNINSLYCSPAIRAQQTIQRIVQSLNIKKDWVTYKNLYTFDMLEIVDFCRNLNDNEMSVSIVGHNPALHDFIEHLTGEHVTKFPTCAYAKLRCNISSWGELKAKCADLKVFTFPKMFEK